MIGSIEVNKFNPWKVENNRAIFDCGCSFSIKSFRPDGSPRIRFQPDISHPDHDINWKCPATYELISRGWTNGVFQLESNLGKSYSKKLGPTEINDIITLGAVLRPGCLDNRDENGVSLTDHYCYTKNGVEEIHYKYPELEPVLSSTLGFLVMQEQAMKISQIIAGFSAIEAEALRKAISKKNVEKMQEVKAVFLEKAKQLALVSEEAAEDIFSWIEKSQKYSFCKCLVGDTKLFTLFDIYREKNITLEKLYYSSQDRAYAAKHGLLDIYEEYRQFGHLDIGYSLTEDGRIVQNKIEAIWWAGYRPVYQVVTESGKEVECSLEHKFPTYEGNRSLCSLKVGDYLLVENGNGCRPDKIKSITYIGIGSCYDLTMAAPHHNFLLQNGIFTSNSHATGYGRTGYITAYEKAHFPLAFFLQKLKLSKQEQDSLKEIEKFVEDAKLFGVQVLPPDIRKMNEDFWSDRKDIYFGLTDIKGIGQSQFQKLKAMPPPTKWIDFLTSSTLSSTVMIALINSGALRCFGLPRKQMCEEYRVWKSFTAATIKLILKVQEETQQQTLISLLERVLDCPGGKGGLSLQSRGKIENELKLLKNPPSPLEDTFQYVRSTELDLLGVSLSGMIRAEHESMANCTILDLQQGKVRSPIICAQIVNLKPLVTKKGKNPGARMANLLLVDNTAKDRFVIFPNAFEEAEKHLIEGATLYFDLEPLSDGYQIKKVWTL